MKLKLDANGNAVLQDGKPVYVHDDGKEVAFDAPATVATIARLNSEAKGHRERAEKAEGDLKLFAGIEDPAAAKKALETVKNLDSKKLVDAGEVEKVKEEATKALKAQYEPIVAERDKLKNELYAEKIGGAFSRSKLITDKFAIPADLVQARFGSHFKIEDGKTVAYDQSGNKIFSRARPGELADFEEALETLVGQYPYKEQILKGSGASGGGASGSGAAGTGGKKTITRAQFEALDPMAKATAAKDKNTVVTD
jgi:hypothetical protein